MRPDEVEIVDRPAGRGHPLIAWAVIVALVGTIIAVRSLELPLDREGEPSHRLLEIQYKYFVGASSFPLIAPEDLYDEARHMGGGSLVNRICFVVLAGELSGPEEALVRLGAVEDYIADEELEPTQSQSRSLQILDRLYQDYSGERWQAPSLIPAERDLLRDELGWLGRLALTPAASPDEAARQAVLAPARRVFFILILAVIGGMLGVLAGLAGAIALGVMTITGTIRSRLGDASAASGASGRSAFGGIYAEAFAVWMVVFDVLGIAAAVVVGLEASALGIHLIVFAVSLSAVFWPTLRGVPWRVVRSDIGLTAGRHWLLEMLMGVVSYVSLFPFVAAALVATIVLLQFAGPVEGGEGGPTHPILNWIAESGWSGRLLVLAMACVAAPIVEETMFRGLLYRHLREATAGFRVGASVAASAAVNGLLFAAIHPQGLFGIPVLTTLAVGFSLAREWRGSLIAPMTAHALNNGIMATLLISML